MDVAIAPAPQRRARLWLVVLAGAIAVLLWLGLRNSDAAPRDLRFTSVTQGPITTEAIGTGELISTSVVALAAPNAGTITDIRKRPGDPIAAGEVIFRLHNRELEARLLAAETELQRANLDAEIAIEAATAHVEEASDTVQTAQRQLAMANTEFDAMRPLAASGAISGLDFSRAQSRADEAQDLLAQAERRERGAAQALTRQRRLQDRVVALAQRVAEQAQLNVTAMSVRTPVAGVVKQMDVRTGESIAQGQVVASVGPMRPDGARLRFPPQFLSDIRLGLQLRLHYQGTTLAATVARVEPELRNGYVYAEAVVTGLPEDARVGVSVRGSAELQQAVAGLHADLPIDLPATAAWSLWRRRSGRIEPIRIADAQRTLGAVVFPADLPSELVRIGDEIAVSIDTAHAATP